MKTNPLFLTLREEKHPIVVVQGGGDAGKTVSILQHLGIESIYNRNLISTVTDQTIPAIKGGALRAFQRYVVPDIQKYISRYNETERTYRFYNGSILEFKSFQDEADARGSERDYLFMNECNAQGYNTFWQLQRKTRRQVYLDYNPTSPFWVHEKLLPNSPSKEMQFFNKVAFYRVWHQHNNFLTPDEHEAYESISDPDLFRVYSRGLTGKIKGLILGHFKQIEQWGMREEYRRVIWGIDYGYTNDPTALLKIGVGGPEAKHVRRRVGREITYEPGLSAESLKNIFMINDLQQGDAIYSEADPNMINQLRALGLPVLPAIKGPGSIAAGLSKLREHEWFYTKDSTNFHKEIMNYKWITAQDILTGKEIMTNQPVDAWNHLCDAARMADYTDGFRNR